jgi:hypothetical protein
MVANYAPLQALHLPHGTYPISSLRLFSRLKHLVVNRVILMEENCRSVKAVFQKMLNLKTLSILSPMPIWVCAKLISYPCISLFYLAIEGFITKRQIFELKHRTRLDTLVIISQGPIPLRWLNRGRLATELVLKTPISFSFRAQSARNNSVRRLRLYNCANITDFKFILSSYPVLSRLTLRNAPHLTVDQLTPLFNGLSI